MTRILVSAGTVTLSAGSATVTGSGTNWLLAGLRPGDDFFDKPSGVGGVIGEVVDDEEITLAWAWAGPSGSGRAYAIRAVGDLTRVAENNVRMEELIRKLELGATALPVGGLTGQVAVKASDDDGDIDWQDRRETLTANRTYYVRTGGSDSNTGLDDTDEGAFLTLQKAINAAAALDISIYDVTIQMRTGTYAGGGVITGPWVGSGNVYIVGDATTPANVVLNVSGNGILAQSGARLFVSGIKFTCTGVGISASGGSKVTVNGLCDFGACGSYHCYASENGSIKFAVGFNQTGGAYAAFGCQSGGIIDISSVASAITGSPAFGGAFANISLGGLLIANSFTFTGSATGTRYLIFTGGQIFTAGGGASVLPGDAGGYADAGTFGAYS